MEIDIYTNSQAEFFDYAVAADFRYYMERLGRELANKIDAESLEVYFRERGDKGINVSITIGKGKEYIEIQRTLYKNRTLDLELMAMSDGLQGMGLAKDIHRAQLNLLKKGMIKRYEVHANITVGGYAWVKYGMTPTDIDEWRVIIENYYDGVDDPNASKKFLDKWKKLKTRKAKIAWVRENINELKPAFLGSNWYGGIRSADEESVKMLSDYIESKPKVTTTRNQSKLIVDIASRNQVYLERIKAQYAKEFESLIKQVNRELSSLMGVVDDQVIKQMSRKEQNAFFKRILQKQKDIFDRYDAEFTRQLKEASELAGELEVAAISTAVAGYYVKPFDAGKAWAEAYKNPIGATGDLLEPFVKDLSSRTLKRLERSLRSSMSQGFTVSQALRAIRGTKANGYRDGILDKNYRDGRTIVRTAVQHVAQQSRNVVFAANADLLNKYQWVSTLDGDTSPKCRTLDTQIFVVGEGPEPPIHPNCRSTTVPYFDDDVELWDDGATRSAEFGPVSVDTTYYSWLKNQPVKFQNDAIGPVRAKLLRDGGLSSKEFAELQLNRNFEPLTIEEMRKLKPNAFEKANI